MFVLEKIALLLLIAMLLLFGYFMVNIFIKENRAISLCQDMGYSNAAMVNGFWFCLDYSLEPRIYRLGSNETVYEMHKDRK